jgi:hypothetical protein
MMFQQPNSRARAMHQVVDRLITGARVTLSFQTESEARQGLDALHEVALSRRVGIVVEPRGDRQVEIYLVEQQAA